MNHINLGNIMPQVPAVDNIENNVVDLAVDTRVAYYKDVGSRQYLQTPALGRVIRAVSPDNLYFLIKSEGCEPPRKKKALDSSYIPAIDDSGDVCLFVLFIDGLRSMEKDNAYKYGLMSAGNNASEVGRIKEKNGWRKLEIGSIFKAQHPYNSNSSDHYGVYIGNGMVIHLSNSNKLKPTIIVECLNAFVHEMEEANKSNIVVIKKTKESLSKLTILRNAVKALGSTNTNSRVYSEYVAKSIVNGLSFMPCSTVSTCSISGKTVDTMINYDQGVEDEKQKEGGAFDEIVNSNKGRVESAFDKCKLKIKNQCTMQ